MTDSTLDGSSVARPPVAPTRQLRLAVVAHPDVSRVGAGLVVGAEPVALSRGAPCLDDGRPLDDRAVSREPALVCLDVDGVLLEGGRWVLDGSDAPDDSPDPSGRPDGALRLGWSELERGPVVWLGRRVALTLEVGPVAEPVWFGRSLAARQIAARAQQLAQLSAPVLVRGPSGAGKERIAHALHERGPRARGPFVSVNLASVPASTAASALFGHTRGAFTGADVASAGLFGAADGGTLFLDEIAAAPLEVQDLLLRAVELGEVLPVGARGPRRVDVRVVAATDADLEAALAAGRFRRPLFYRLAAQVIDVPPLAARRADVAPLFVAHLAEERAALGLPAVEVPARLLVELLAQPLAGNVRELRALAARWALDGSLPAAGESGAQNKTPATQGTEGNATAAVVARRSAATRPALDAGRVREALVGANGVLAQAARRLGVSNAALHQFLERSGAARRACDVPAEELAQALAEGGEVADVARRLGVTLRGLQLRLTRERAPRGGPLAKHTALAKADAGTAPRGDA